MEKAQVTLSIRRTHKFAPGWAHMDEYDDVGTAKVLMAGKCPGETWEAWQSMILIEMVDLEKDISPKDFRQSIYDSFGHSGCRHEHDCCGCVSTTVSTIEEAGQNRYLLTLDNSRNV